MEAYHRKRLARGTVTLISCQMGWGKCTHLDNNSMNSKGQMTCFPPRRLALISTRTGLCGLHNWCPFSADLQGLQNQWLSKETEEAGRRVWVGRLTEVMGLEKPRTCNETYKQGSKCDFSVVFLGTWQICVEEVCSTTGLDLVNDDKHKKYKKHKKIRANKNQGITK